MKRSKRKLEHRERRGTAGEEIIKRGHKNIRGEERCDEENEGEKGYEGEEMVFRRTGRK